MIAVDDPGFAPLARFTADLLDARRQRFPAIVRAGRMTRAEADRGILIAAVLAEIWSAAADTRIPDPERIGRVTRREIVCDLLLARDAINRTLASHACAKQPCDALTRYRDQLNTLLDWHCRFVDGPLLGVRATLQLRRLGETQRHAA